MQRASAIAGSAIFLVVAPGTLAVYVPWLITRWHLADPFFGIYATRVLGGVLIAAGLPVLLECFGRFAINGLGTPAPVAPPQRLVVTGLYRYVRNPMYVAVLSLVIGQGLLFASIALLEYGVLVCACFMLFVLLYEQPALRAKFGGEYREYCRKVPAWIPRMTPWQNRGA